jgi:hypothetical protein
LLNALRDSLTDKPHIYDFTVVPVSDRLGPPESNFSSFGSSVIYKGKETNLRLAVGDASSRPRDFMVLVTDGVMSLKLSERLAPGAPAASACASGSEPGCLAFSIANYIEPTSGVAIPGSQHGFWIVGIRMPFAGPHYIEEPCPDAPTRRIIRKGTFPNRPLYIWVGASSLQQGSEFIKGLISFAQTNHLDTLVVEVAPGRWIGPTIAQGVKTVDSSSDNSCKRGDLWEDLLQNENEGNYVIKARARNFWHAVPTFGFELPTKWIDPYPRPPVFHSLLSVSEKVESETDGAAVHNSNLLGSSLDICLWFSGDLAKAQSRLGKDVDLDSAWAVNETRGSPWKSWSTDSDCTIESVGSTLHLDTFVGHLRSELDPADDDITLKTPLIKVRY